MGYDDPTLDNILAYGKLLEIGHEPHPEERPHQRQTPA